MLRDRVGRASAGTGYLCTSIGLVSPVKNLRLETRSYFSRDTVVQERRVASKELRVPAASFINQFPERPVKDCLTIREISASVSKVVEREQALTIRRSA